jgi:hypothetical protein
MNKLISKIPFNLVKLSVFAALTLFFSSCRVVFVQEYDEKLVVDTELIFKKASIVVDKGISKSPKTDDERAKINPSDKSDAHFSKFSDDYNELIRDSDALILRSLAKSGEINDFSAGLQEKFEIFIEGLIPSACVDLDEELKKSTKSLTVKNYIDLKCYFTKWKNQHSDTSLTNNTLILKKANWEARKSGVFNIILAIQKAEAFKKK